MIYFWAPEAGAYDSGSVRMIQIREQVLNRSSAPRPRPTRARGDGNAWASSLTTPAGFASAKVWDNLQGHASSLLVACIPCDLADNVDKAGAHVCPLIVDGEVQSSAAFSGHPTWVSVTWHLTHSTTTTKVSSNSKSGVVHALVRWAYPSHTPASKQACYCFARTDHLLRHPLSTFNQQAANFSDANDFWSTAWHLNSVNGNVTALLLVFKSLSGEPRLSVNLEKVQAACSWISTTKDRSKEMAVYKKTHPDHWVKAISHRFSSQQIRTFLDPWTWSRRAAELCPQGPNTQWEKATTYLSSRSWNKHNVSFARDGVMNATTI